MADCVPDFFTQCPEVVEEVVVEELEQPTELPTDEAGEEMPERPPMEEEMMMEKEEEMLDTFLESQIAFLVAALMGATMSGMDLFAWKYQTKITDSTNGISVADTILHFQPEQAFVSYVNGSKSLLWKNASTTMTWTTFVFTSVAFLTQLLSMFGIMGDINLMVWLYGGSIAAVTGGIAEIIALVRYVDAKVVLAMETDNATALTNKATAADTLIKAMELDMIHAGVKEVASAIMALEHGAMWFKGQVHMLINSGALTEAEAMEMWGGDDKKDESDWEDYEKEEHMEMEEKPEMEEESAEESAEEEPAVDDFADFFGLYTA
jgi:hypothetical protein